MSNCNLNHKQVIESKISTMITMQDDLNNKINPEWKVQKYDWQRCIMVELAELMDHFGYKFWKKQNADLNQCKLEVLDIFHFWLSHNIANNKAEDFLFLVNNYSRKSSEIPQYTDEDIRLKIDAMISKAADKRFLTADMIELIDLFMDFNNLYEFYFAKNCLNIFRQENGYKTGEYIKNWNGKEDNEVLMEIIAVHGYEPLIVFKELKKNYAKANIKE